MVQIRLPSPCFLKPRSQLLCGLDIPMELEAIAMALAGQVSPITSEQRPIAPLGFFSNCSCLFGFLGQPCNTMAAVQGMLSDWLLAPLLGAARA